MTVQKVVCLSGGVGGAKLLLGLQEILPAGELTAIINTGDDFDHFGLRICPDIDTALYTLSGLSNPELGWGRKDETWSFMETLETLGGATWFRLGDADLALHVERTRRLKRGSSLEEIVAELARSFGISTKIVPMTNDEVRTRVVTSAGELDFQHYFVRLGCEPELRSCRFSGVDSARAARGVEAAFAENLRAIIIAPSNPYLSIDPILSLGQIKSGLQNSCAPVIAVTPLIGGEAVKGPTAKIMRELGKEVSPLAIAHYYREQGLIDGFVLDVKDADLADQFDIPVAITDTLMKNTDDKKRVAQVALSLAEKISGLDFNAS